LAWALINEGVEGIEILANHLDKFLQSKAADQAQLARVMMRRGMKPTLAKNLNKFADGAVNQTQLAHDLLASGRKILLARNLDNFQEGAVDHTQLARDLMNSNGKYVLAYNLDKFADGAVDHAELAHNLLESGPIGRDILALNLDKFSPQAVDHVQLVRDLVDEGRGNLLAHNLDNFPELPDDVRERLPAKVVRTPTTTDPAGRYHQPDRPIKNE
jgi:hypothetical protein